MGLGEAGLFFEVADGLQDLGMAVAAEPAHHLTCCAGALAVIPDCLGEWVIGVGEVFQGGYVGAATVPIDILTGREFEAVSEAGEEMPQPATQCASSSGCSPAMNYR